MRLNLKLTPNTEVCPFNYQKCLVGRFHKWIGENNIHDNLSLYSISWLSHGEKIKSGFNFKNGAAWRISAHDTGLLKKLIEGITSDPEVCFGMEVSEVCIEEPPATTTEHRFFALTPVHIKRSTQDRIKYFYHNDPESSKLLSETMQNKLAKAGVESECTVMFDADYQYPRVKGIVYDGLRIKGTLCPILIKGEPEAIQFAWSVGIGNSTGIGFGAIR